MDIDQDSLEQFLSLSVRLTGFDRAALQGTGLLEEYYRQIVGVIGEAIGQELWEVARQLSARACENSAAREGPKVCRLAAGGKVIRTRGPPKCRYAKRIVCVERRPSPGI
jgi:hypothetical protein